MKWEILTTEQQFSDLLAQDTTFAVFKHSTRCSISSMAKNRVERDWNLEFPIYYLDLIQHRSVSNFIASQSGVHHESPQLIVFQHGKPVYNASHSVIMVQEIRQELAI